MIRPEARPRLTDVDLQLYLAGAMPLGKRLLLRWALRLDPELRGRLARLREENSAFQRKEMRRLEGILFPAHLGGGKGGSARAEPARERGPAWLPTLAGAFCVLLFCALPFTVGPRNVAGGSLDEAVNDPDVIAKGRGLGVSLFVKGDSAYRVENQAARVAATDTLQVMPLGAEPQYLALLGWDARQGLVRLFPREGGRAPRVSRAAPPPALLLQDVADNRLICVTATGPFSVADAEAALSGKPFQPMEKAPASHLGKGLYLQIFSITKSAGRI